MNAIRANTEKVLIVGKSSLAYSVAVCLLRAKCMVYLCTDNAEEALNSIQTHFIEMKKDGYETLKNKGHLKVGDNCGIGADCSLAIVITDEKRTTKKDTINLVKNSISKEAPIAINTESYSLEEIQGYAAHPERVIGLNWTEPAHTTHFLEIITNKKVKPGLAEWIQDIAKESWNKDPYIVDNLGIRSKLLSAMIREAFYLVENGYATIDDIDRACRNDAGYYLPFAGNCRYMDLMGTYAYGMVMKDLNPDLSKEQSLPEFYNEIIKNGGRGMENGEGFYQYTPEEKIFWEKIVSEFSYRIEKIISKYPFNYK